MMVFSIASTYLTRVNNIGLSVCGILFYLQITNSLNLTVLQDLLAEFCRHTDCSQDFTYLVMHDHSKWLGWSKGQRCVRIFSSDGARTTCGTAKFELYTEEHRGLGT